MGYRHACLDRRYGIVNNLKSMGALKMKLVAPMPEQIVTNPMQFLHVQGIFSLMKCIVGVQSCFMAWVQRILIFAPYR